MIVNKKLDKLEAIRGFAAIYVIFHHTLKKGLIFGGIDFSFIFRFGQEAVILFFILSGFVIEYSFSKSKDHTFKTYFLKRFLRIYVPLFCVFLLNLLIVYFNDKDFNFSLLTFIGNILMLQDVSSLKPNVIINTFLGNLPLWSLSYEWWFYMLYFPIVKFLKNKSSNFVYLIGICAAITYLFYPNFLNRELFYFVIWWSGVVLARVYVLNNEIKLINLKNLFVSLFIIIIILTLNVFLNYKGGTVGLSPILELRHFIFSFVIILVALGWYKFKWIGFDYTIGIFKRVAPISFGLYISHYFLISNASYLNAIILNKNIKLIIYIINCILFSYLIERLFYPFVSKCFFRKAIILKTTNNI